MHQITSQIASEMDVLYGLYKLANDFTRKIEPGKEQGVTKWLDTRQRILSKTAASSKFAAALLKALEKEQNVPANERALIEEKKNLVNQALKDMQRTEYEIMKKMRKKMKELSGELVTISNKKKAAQAYIQAPRATMLVS